MSKLPFWLDDATEEAPRLVQWKASSGHPGGWRVTRDYGNQPPSPFSGSFEEATGPSGRLRLFKTCVAAQKAADLLNKSEREA